MKDFLDSGLQDYSAVPTLYAISVLHHLDLKTHFDNHCIFSESMFVLLEKKTTKELQGELDCLVRPFCKYLNCTDRDKLTSAYILSVVWEKTQTTNQVYYVISLSNNVNMTKLSHCAPLATYTFVTVCLSLEYVCRNGCHSFEGFFYTTYFSLFGVFIHRMTLWREMNVFEKSLVLSILIGRQTVPYSNNFLLSFYTSFPLPMC